jgi:non-canonical (house-cleaning) NTP pyrophosphatase
MTLLLFVKKNGGDFILPPQIVDKIRHEKNGSLTLGYLFRNLQVMDDLKELQGCIHAFSK